MPITSHIPSILTLFELGEPVILESSTKDIEVNEGDSVTLTCNAQGYPTPKIEWQKADAQPLSSGHIRQIVCSSSSNEAD